MGYFRGVSIFVIFMVNPGLTKFSTHTAALSTSANVRTRRHFYIAVVRHLCHVDSALDP